MGHETSTREWGKVDETDTILVVDDEPRVLYTVGKMLEMGGLGVMSAESGRQALNVFRDNVDRISAVLLDLTMPDMDGMAVLHELRQIKSNVRVILSSGYAEEDTPPSAQGDAPDGFIQKPFGPQTLLQEVNKVIHH